MMRSGGHQELFIELAVPIDRQRALPHNCTYMTALTLARAVRVFTSYLVAMITPLSWPTVPVGFFAFSRTDKLLALL